MNPAGLTHLAMGLSSFIETYTERALNVNRPFLNETNLDPDYYLMPNSYVKGDATDKDNTILLKAWVGQENSTDQITFTNSQIN